MPIDVRMQTENKSKLKCTNYENLPFFENTRKTMKKSTRIFLKIKTKRYVIETHHLHMLGVGTNAVYQLCGLNLSRADFVDGSEEWEFVFHALSLQHVVHLFGGDWTLK